MDKSTMEARKQSNSPSYSAVSSRLQKIISTNLSFLLNLAYNDPTQGEIK